MEKSEEDPSGLLKGKEVAFTGRLASMTRAEAAELVRGWGGEFRDSVSRRTAILVVGEDGWPLSQDGRLTHKLVEAGKLKERGHPISILTEERFLALLGLDGREEEIRRLYTVSQLARLLDLPGSRLRLWMRAGLIQPVETRHHLAYFDLRRVSAARSVDALVRAGVPLNRIRRAVEDLRALGLDATAPVEGLQFLERYGRLYVRLAGGQLAEPSGQLCFDFVAPDPGTVVAFQAAPRGLEEWLDAALAEEEAGRSDDAEETYGRAIQAVGPDPELSFNLGNLLHARGRAAEAAARFLEAVELDPEFAEAWNNLGNVVGELGRHEEAVLALGRALELDPHYADAHFNLAEELHVLGRTSSALPHWRKYLGYDRRSSWAQIARDRLARTGPGTAVIVPMES